MVADNIIRMHLTFNARLDIGAQIFRKLIALRRVILLALEPLVEQRSHHAAHISSPKFFVICWFKLIRVFNYLLPLYLGKVVVSHAEQCAARARLTCQEIKFTCLNESANFAIDVPRNSGIVSSITQSTTTHPRFLPTTPPLPST